MLRFPLIVVVVLGVAGCSHWPGRKTAADDDADAGMNRMMDDAPDSLRNRKNSSAAAKSAGSSGTQLVEDAPFKKSSAVPTTAATVKPVAETTPKASEDRHAVSDVPIRKSASTPSNAAAVEHETKPTKSKAKRSKKTRPDDIPDASDVGL